MTKEKLISLSILLCFHLRYAASFHTTLLPFHCCARSCYFKNCSVGNTSSGGGRYPANNDLLSRSINRMKSIDHTEDDHSTVVKYTKRGLVPEITTVHKFNDFQEFISKDEQLCIVKFYASWCKSCYKFGIKYKKLAMKLGDKSDKTGQIQEQGQVRFAEVEYSKNASLCKKLGIKKLPYIIIYKASVGKIAEFSCGPRRFEDKLANRVFRYIDINDDELQFEQKMEAGTSLVDDVLSQLNHAGKKTPVNQDDLEKQQYKSEEIFENS